MKKSYFLLILTVVLCHTNLLIAQTQWTGPPTTFTKSNNTDWTLEANQDRITNNVWITRANNSGLFNIVTETQSDGVAQFGTSPADTEWAFGTISDGVGTLTFATFNATHAGSPPNMVNQDMVLHLITDDIYIDIKFTSWSGGGSGGGFSYTRSTDQSLGVNDFDLKRKIKLFPNPSSAQIMIYGLTTAKKYKIYNVLGLEVATGTSNPNQEINIQNLTEGIYFLSLEEDKILKFIKE